MFKGLAGVLFYVGVGFLFVTLNQGSDIDWSSGLTYAFLFGWPILVAAIGLIGVAIFFVALVIVHLFRCFFPRKPRRPSMMRRR